MGGCAPIRGGMDLQRGHLLVKMCAKMKELGPIGGHASGMPPLDPPMLLCAVTTMLIKDLYITFYSCLFFYLNHYTLHSWYQ